MTVRLWVPAADQPHWPCVMSWLNLETPDNQKLIPVPGRALLNNIRYTWNPVVKDFLDSKDEWLFSVHSDVVMAPKTLMRLLSWDKPLVSALIFMRTSPPTPHIWQTNQRTGRYAVPQLIETHQWLLKHKDDIRLFGPYVMEQAPEDALTILDFTSTSCLLIHRSVLEGMRKSVDDVWFRWDDETNGGGEDRNFFQNAKLAGFDGYTDRSCIAGHLVGDIPTSAADFIAWLQSSEFVNTGE